MWPGVCQQSEPFVKRQKNDAANAAAIAEAARRPNMHYVEVKSVEHQARAVAFRTHQCFVRQRTQLINALRGHLGELGIVVAQGPTNLAAVVGILADETNELPAGVREIGQLYGISLRIRKQIEDAFGWIKAIAGQDKTKFRGRDRVGWAFTLAVAAYDLVRLPKLMAASP